MSIRCGLPHIATMHHDEFFDLVDAGSINLSRLTEKTDGAVMTVGYDREGFYSQSSASGSERMRSIGDYINRVERREKLTGKPGNYKAARSFGVASNYFLENERFQYHLKRMYTIYGQVIIKGEIFHLPDSIPGNLPGEVKFVGTSYRSDHMGSIGKFVIHNRLPENRYANNDHIVKNLGDQYYNFDTDHIEHNFTAEETTIDLTVEKQTIDQLDQQLIKSRKTKNNKNDKESEVAILAKIQYDLSNKIDAHVRSMQIKPKWGSGTEGLVVHPSPGSRQPRFKVTSDEFRRYKATC